MVKQLLLIFILFLCWSALSQNLRRLAGDSLGMPGFSGDGGLVKNAKLNGPASLSTDSTGNIYFVDMYNNRIRKISKSTNIITTVLQSSSLTFLTLDKSANIYFTQGHSIQKWDAQTSVITTIAGTPGTNGFSGDSGLAIAATLNGPQGLAIDKKHNYLYIADCYNNRIRRIDLFTGIITTVVGTGVSGLSGDNGPATAAQISGPLGIAADSSGNLYFTDANHRIRKVDYSSGIITTFAGTTQGYGGDNGSATAASMNYPNALAFDNAYQNLYVVDAGNSMVRKINLATDTITRVAGNGSFGFAGDGGPAIYATLGYPFGVCISNTDDIIIADTDNNVLRQIEGPPEWPYHQFPDSNAVWNFECISINGPCSSGNTLDDKYSIVISGDTIINNKSYHKLHVYYVNRVDPTCTQNYIGYKGAYRDDTTSRKVYYVPPSSSAESLLYDFTLDVGDTIKGCLAVAGLGGPDIVHSRDSVLVGTSYRARWHINNSYNINIIEGVGSTYGLINVSLGELADGSLYDLTCFQQNGAGLYPYLNVNCQQITGINSFEEPTLKMRVFPNPASNCLNIECSEPINEVCLYDVLGNKVGAELHVANSIDISGYPNGVYHLAVKTITRSVSKKVIIER